MSDVQKAIIYQLDRSDAVRLIEARDIGTWKRICEKIQQMANSGLALPINVVRFYMAVSWDFESRRYIARETQPGCCAAL